MSLLLDALKKSGAAQQGANGLSASGSLSEMSLPELELESLPGKPASASAAATQSSSATTSPSPRSTGENLFAAKKSPPAKRFNYTLGIIPTAIIIGLVLGTAGGIYVWIEIQPPKAAQYRGTPTVAAITPAPVSRPPLPVAPLTMPAENKPFAETQPRVNRVESAQTKRPRPSGISRPAGTLTAPGAQSMQGIQVQKQIENDGLYTALLAAYQSYQNGDLGTAWQRYRDVLLKDPKNRDALLGMAAIAQQQGQDDSAIQYYRQVLILDPRDPVAHAGMSAFSTGDVAAKESRLKLSLAQSPQSAALHFALGNVYTEQSRWGDAQQAYFSAYNLEPANAQFAFSLATSLDHLGQAKLAAQYYETALKLSTTGSPGFDRTRTEQRLKQLTVN